MNKSYTDEHGVPRFADGTIDHDERRWIWANNKMDRLAAEISDMHKLDRLHTQHMQDERDRYAGLPWWSKLWEVRP